MSTFSEHLNELISEFDFLQLSTDETEIYNTIFKLLEEYNKKVKHGEAIPNLDLTRDTLYAYYCEKIKNRRKILTFTFLEKLSDLEDLCSIYYFNLSKDERKLGDSIIEIIDDYINITIK